MWLSDLCLYYIGNQRIVVVPQPHGYLEILRFCPRWSRVVFVAGAYTNDRKKCVQYSIFQSRRSRLLIVEGTTYRPSSLPISEPAQVRSN